MKKLIKKIIKVLNEPSDKVNPNIFIALVLIMVVASKFVDPRIIIVFGVFTILAMVIYIIISIVKYENLYDIRHCSYVTCRGIFYIYVLR